MLESTVQLIDHIKYTSSPFTHQFRFIVLHIHWNNQHLLFIAFNDLIDHIHQQFNQTIIESIFIQFCFLKIEYMDWCFHHKCTDLHYILNIHFVSSFLAIYDLKVVQINIKEQSQEVVQQYTDLSRQYFESKYLIVYLPAVVVSLLIILSILNEPYDILVQELNSSLTLRSAFQYIELILHLVLTLTILCVLDCEIKWNHTIS